MAITKAKLIADGVITVDNLHESHGITTTHIGEGNKLFYTDTRVSNYLSANNYITTSDVPNLETVTSLSISANILSYVNEAGITTNIDLSTYLDDTNLARLVSGTLNPGTGIATFTRDDLSTFTIDFSAFLADANDYVSSGSFNTSTGVLTLTRLGGGTVTVDLDGKYAEASHTHLWSHITDRPTALSAFTNDLGNYGGFVEVESDPTVPSHVKSITNINISNWDTAYGWGNHAGLYSLLGHTHDYLPIGGKAVDSELLDGVDSSRVIYGSNSTGTSYISGATLGTALKSGFYTTDGGVPNASAVNFVLHTAYYGEGNLAGFDLACNDSTSSSFYLRPATGGGKGAWQTIITSSNVGSQSVNYASSAGNADTVDSLHASSFVRSDQNAVTIQRHLDASTTWTNSILSLFLGWNGGKVVIGNNNDSLHDAASAEGANSIVLTNATYSFKQTYMYHDNSLKLYMGSDGTRNTGWAYHTNNDSGLHWPNNGWHLMPANGTYFRIYSGSSSEVALRMETAGTTRGYIYADSSNNIGFLNTSASWRFRVDNSGNTIAAAGSYARGFYDDDNTLYQTDPSSMSSMYGIAIRGDQSSTGTSNQIFFWDGGNTTTSSIGFKYASGIWAEHGTTSGGYNTYFTMDTTNRGWVFRRATIGGNDFTGINVASISNTGNAQFDGSARAPIFSDNNDTNYYLEPTAGANSKSLMVDGFVGWPNHQWTWSRGAHQDPTNSIKIWDQYSSNGGSGNPTAYGTILHITGRGAHEDDQLIFTYDGQILHRNAFYGSDSWSSWNSVATARHSFTNNVDLRAPIFYDSDDAAFYLDPNGTSELSNITNGTRARWGRSRYNTNRQAYQSDQGYWTGTNGWGTSEGTWDAAWKGGFSGWDIWGGGSAHPQGSQYVHAQGIVSGQHYTSADGGSAYGWMMVGAHNATDNRYWLRGKWDTSVSGWVEMYTTGNMDAPNKSGTSYYQTNTWMQFNGQYGLYWPNNNGAHLYPNNITSYGQLATSGSKNSYGGIADSYSGVNGIMYDSAGNGGMYREANSRWYFYHHVGNNCTAINNSTTSSSYGLYVEGAIYSTGDITAYSDVRKKTNIATIDSALDKVTKLRGVYYDRIDDLERGRQVGVIAQEVNEVLPEAVTYAEDIDEYGVKYGNIVGVLIEAIKEQQKQIEELKAIVNGITK